MSFKPSDSGQTHSDSDHATNLPKCQEKMNLKPSSYLVLHCINSFRQADSFKTSFNLHVIHGRLRSSTVAVKVLLCSMTSSCIDLIVSQIATKSSYALSALVKETEPVRIRQTVKANSFPCKDHLIMFHALRSRVCTSSKGSDRGALLKQIEGGFLAIMFFLKRNDFSSTDLWCSCKPPPEFETGHHPEMIRYIACLTVKLYS